MSTFQLFTFGTRLWRAVGTTLFDTTTAIEALRGYGPPVFVDVSPLACRIDQASLGRGGAELACGQLAFDETIAPASLIATVTSPPHHSTPEESASAVVSEIVALVARLRDQRRRVILACGCWVTRKCIRHLLAELVALEAHQRQMAIGFEEWPGGEPRVIELALEPDQLARVMRGALSLVAPMPRVQLATVPWASMVQVLNANASKTFVTGPGQPSLESPALCLPVFGRFDGPASDPRVQRFTAQLRHDLGFFAPNAACDPSGPTG